MTELQYVAIHPKYGPGIAELQKICLPNTPPDYHFNEKDVAEMSIIFPDGAFVVLDGENVVGLGAGIFLDFDFAHTQHTLYELTGESACKNHNLDGAYYYGTDITVHPDYRRRGIGKRLYDLRKEVVRRYNKKGIIAGGMLPGFVNHKAHMSAAEYAQRVTTGEFYDRTLTFQLENGFQLLGVLQNYYPDTPSDGWASLIMWENPEYKEQ